MKNEKARRIAGAVMLGAALLFFIYALSHPEGSFAMENSTTYLLYAKLYKGRKQTVKRAADNK